MIRTPNVRPTLSSTPIEVENEFGKPAKAITVRGESDSLISQFFVVCARNAVLMAAWLLAVVAWSQLASQLTVPMSGNDGTNSLMVLAKFVTSISPVDPSGPEIDITCPTSVYTSGDAPSERKMPQP